MHGSAAPRQRPSPLGPVGAGQHAVPFPSQTSAPLARKASSGADIRIELSNGDQLITLYGLLSAATECLSALEHWQR